MTEPRRNEKEEKDEKGRDESWDEKWRRDPVEAATWAFVLIWVGVVWLLSSASLLGDFLPNGAEAWGLGFLGAGVIVLLAVGARLLVPAWRRPVTGSIILGLVFVGIGLVNIIPKGVKIVGPLVLIGIGLAGLAAYFFSRRE